MGVYRDATNQHYIVGGREILSDSDLIYTHKLIHPANVLRANRIAIFGRQVRPLIDIVIRLSGGRLLQSVWQYISPPTPAINKKTFTVDGFQKRWMRQGPGESILRFTVSNLLTKYGWNFDSLDVSIQGQMAISVEHVRVASSVEVRAVVSRPIVTGSFNLRLHVRKGSSEVGVVEVFDDQTQSSEPSFCVVEVRDTGAPSLISFTPLRT